MFLSRFLCSAFLFSLPIIVSLVLYWKCCTSWKNSHPSFIILLLLSCPLEFDVEKTEEETNTGRYEDTRSVFHHVEAVSVSAMKKEVTFSRKYELEINE